MPIDARSLRIREALPQEANLLSQLALRSKAHWGYSRDFLDACRSELTVDASRLGTEDYQCFVAIDGGSVLGFYTLKNTSSEKFELEALFVEPEHIGSGVGRALIRDAVERLSKRGAKRLIIQGDPHAAEFYVAAGARQIGTRESESMPGRNLPLFEIAIAKR
ncbi:MAG: GNAT family N-acetyltransferase [Woeseiaceae bacterium]|nr:GNAT family N-acetyltransferase [Woeseiaceae bacterium]